MKIPTNKIVGWQKTKNCLPVLDALVLIQSKEDKYSYETSMRPEYPERRSAPVSVAHTR